MCKFLRKVLLVLNLPAITIVTKGVPAHLEQLLRALYRPLAHPFKNPFSGQIINESEIRSGKKVQKGYVQLAGIKFVTPKPYSYQKTKKRGRIKRKIRRKLVRLNRVID